MTRRHHPTAIHVAGYGFALALAALSAAPSQAAPLDAEACVKLHAQRNDLALKGVPELIARGPQSQVLEREQLSAIRAFMHIEGQLRFRCPLEQNLVNLHEESPADAAAGEETPQQTGGQAPSLEAARPASQRRSTTVEGQPASGQRPAEPAGRKPPRSTSADATGRANAAPATDQPSPVRSRARNKVDDAYRPPPKGEQPASGNNLNPN